MILNILSILMVLGIAMLWGIRGKGRGLFSALITFVCVFIAGAVAIGLWETVTTRFLIGWREDLAWCLGLAVPFAITLAILRVIAELSISKNVKVDDLSNFVGGAIFGLGSGVITTGILVMSLGSINFGPNFPGPDPVDQTGGDLVNSGGLWIPVDEWTAKLYEHLSINSFDAGENSLALRNPDLHEQVAMNRLVYSKDTQDGMQIARNALQPGEASIGVMYTGADLSNFLSSATINAPRLSPKDADGNPFPAGSTMAGFVVQFQAGAREEGGQVVIGPGQVRLVYRLDNGTADAVHPHAIISDPEVNAAGKVWFPRNSKELFVPTVGGESRSSMGFEFALPPTARPTDLIVKNLRLPIDVAALEPAEYTSAEQRDLAILSGTLFAGGARVTKSELNSADITQDSEGFNPTPRLGRRIIDITTGRPGSLQLNSDNQIVSGKAEILNTNLNNRGLDRNNRVDGYADGENTRIVQLTLSEAGVATPMGQIVQRTGYAGRPYIFDTEGRSYDAIGYLYSDGLRTWISFAPGAPLSSMNDIEDQLSPSKRDQTLILIFRPSEGVTIDGFAIGDNLVGDFNFPLN